MNIHRVLVFAVIASLAVCSTVVAGGYQVQEHCVVEQQVTCVPQVQYYAVAQPVAYQAVAVAVAPQQYAVVQETRKLGLFERLRMRRQAAKDAGVVARNTVVATNRVVPMATVAPTATYVPQAVPAQAPDPCVGEHL